MSADPDLPGVDPGDNAEMRHEAFFSEQGPYDVLLRGNVLLHSQAAELMVQRLAPLDEARNAELALDVLDLACGGRPDTIASVIACFPDRWFRYTGVDINPHQIALAREYAFPEHVVSTEILEGSAWYLEALQGAGPFDLVYVGMNWHHGTPEEIGFLARQLRRLLRPHGMLLNHDCYRPEGTPYVRRPDLLGTESLTLVAPDLLLDAGLPDYGLSEANPADSKPPWKSELIELLERGYLQAGGDVEGARVLTQHSWARDYPLAASEVKAVLQEAGFRVLLDRVAERAPMADYVGLVSAQL